MSKSKKLAQAKIAVALQLIERAQELLSEACAELCPIVGMQDEWEHVGHVHDEVKAAWHVVNLASSRESVDLDSVAKRRMEEM